MRRQYGLILSAALTASAGCANSEAPEGQLFSYSRAKAPEGQLFSYSRAKMSEAPAAEAKTSAMPPAAPDAAPPAGEGDSTKSGGEVPPAASRKIIYTAQVTLIVESLSGFDAKFTKLVKESGGYVSQTDQSTQADAQRSGSWTIRVPVERFDGFLKAVSGLGELQRSHLDSQDVTMEYYDLEARISNKQQEEKRLLKHLSDSTGKLEDILAVEREMTRVRGEIEQMQGRIRYLGNLSALSTVTLTVSEIHNYVPPARPTFSGQIARTFNESLESLIGLSKAVVLFVVAIVPWLPLLIVLALLILWVLRKLFRRRPPIVLTRNAP